MQPKRYLPTISVLHIENNETVASLFHESLLQRNIYVHAVDNLQEALWVVENMEVDLIVSDGMFPREKGLPEEKSFIPLAEGIRSLGKKIPIIAWSNSTHVHEYCEAHNLESYSKLLLTRERFLEKGRAYIEVKVFEPETMAERIEEVMVEQSGLRAMAPSLKLKHYYTEPATVLAFFMALDMRTSMFEATAGLNYGPMISEINNGIFTLYLDQAHDAKIAHTIYHKILEENFFSTLSAGVATKSKELLAFSRTLKDRDYAHISKTELAELYLEFCERFMQMRTYSSLPTAMEHETNIWTEHLTKILKGKISDVEELNKTFSLLTTPEKTSYVNNYEAAVAKVGLMQCNGQDSAVAIKRIIDQYAWVQYAFEGNPITEKDVLEKIEVLGKTKDDFEQFLIEREERPARLRGAKKEKINQYRLARSAKLFAIGAEIVFIKFFRKGVFAESYYHVEFLLAEIGNRIGCTRKQVVNLLAGEVLAALALDRFPARLVDYRMKASVLFSHAGRSYALSDAAKAVYRSSIMSEAVSEELKGQVAYPGKVVGTVTVVNLPSEMSKMEEGNVLVSRSTNPALVPAMRKASALVTDLGGLTCHAAIIAREMKKPCIVGTKNATTVLVDGDKVEVDANKGIVRKVS